MVEYLRNRHPKGVAGHLKNATLLDDMRKAGIRGGDKTLRRAMSEAYSPRLKTR
jgi:hypothetical protein